MAATLRLVLLGSQPVWLPPFRDGRLLVGSAATADTSLAPSALLPFHCLVELDPGAQGSVLVHDLARRGDVRDAGGAPVLAQGTRVLAGGSFSIAGRVVGLVSDEEDVATAAQLCVVCREAPREGRGRVVGTAIICLACAGVTDVDAFDFPGYELLAALGAGSMGKVYLARPRASDRLVALKVLGEATRTVRFERETSALAALDHPHVVRILDAGTSSAGRFLVCELVRGGDAAARFARTGPFPAAEVTRLGVEVSSALAYLHANRIVHRDVKPANVLLEPDLTAKLSDFGLVKDLGVAAPGTATGSGVTLGTIAYSAPEQLRDARSAGPSADVFALGATLFHLATGRLPRQGVSIAALRQSDWGSVPEAASVAPVARALSDALAAAMRPVPGERPSASELGAMLLRVLANVEAR
jgi:hypothetical protein